LVGGKGIELPRDGAAHRITLAGAPQYIMLPAGVNVTVQPRP
jgi:hypothetical protein